MNRYAAGPIKTKGEHAIEASRDTVQPGTRKSMACMLTNGQARGEKDNIRMEAGRQ
jgi:hypothetical protein